MAGNKKISQLVDGGAGQAGDNFVIERGGVNFKVDNESVSGNPGGLLLNGVVNDMIVKDEKSEVALEQRITLPAVISFVDNTAVPPTEIDGDIYLLDDTGASNAAWDGASQNSWVRFDGLAGTWKEISAIDGFIVTEQDTGDVRFFKPTSGTWELLGGSPAGADTEIQFNNAGAFGASSLFTFNTAFAEFSCDANAVFNESGLDRDFRIEGLSDINLFFVDASTDRVGIGTVAPTSKFEVDISTNHAFRIIDTTIGGIAGTFGAIAQLKRSSNDYLNSWFAIDSSGKQITGWNSREGYEWYINGNQTAFSVLDRTSTTPMVAIGEKATTAQTFKVLVNSNNEGVFIDHTFVAGAGATYRALIAQKTNAPSAGTVTNVAAQFEASAGTGENHALILVAGDFAYRDTTPAQITGDQDDFSTNGFSSFRLDTDALRNVTGFANGTDGKELVIHNVGSFDLVLQDENAGSLAVNRIITGNAGTDLTLNAGDSWRLKYDGTSTRWRLTPSI